MIREGEWWDFIDPISQGLIGILLMNSRSEMNIILDKWIDDENLWIRRTAILAHLKHKENMDQEKLFNYCRSFKTFPIRATTLLDHIFVVVDTAREAPIKLVFPQDLLENGLAAQVSLLYSLFISYLSIT